MNPADLADMVHRDAADGVQQHVVGAVIERQGCILLLKRPSDDFRGGTWELPSGKAEPGDSDLIAALHREVGEETGMTSAEVGRYLGAFDYVSGSGKRTRQHTWAVTVSEPAEVGLSEHDDHTWAEAAETHPVSPEVQRLIDVRAANSPGTE